MVGKLIATEMWNEINGGWENSYYRTNIEISF